MQGEITTSNRLSPTLCSYIITRIGEVSRLQTLTGSKKIFKSIIYKNFGASLESLNNGWVESLIYFLIIFFRSVVPHFCQSLKRRKTNCQISNCWHQNKDITYYLTLSYPNQHLELLAHHLTSEVSTWPLRSSYLHIRRIKYLFVLSTIWHSATWISTLERETVIQKRFDTLYVLYILVHV
jgi:hypothetical protein